MLYVRVNGEERKIIFRHEKETIEGNQKHPVRTVCGIFNGETPIAEGVAKVHKLDRFEYEKGRKISLKYALEAAEMTRDERRQIWEQYNAR